MRTLQDDAFRHLAGLPFVGWFSKPDAFNEYYDEKLLAAARAYEDAHRAAVNTDDYDAGLLAGARAFLTKLELRECEWVQTIPYDSTVNDWEVRKGTEILRIEAELTDLALDTLDQIFDVFVRDFSAYATGLLADGSADRTAYINDDRFRMEVKNGLAIARNEKAPDLVMLPVPAPEDRS